MASARKRIVAMMRAWACLLLAILAGAQQQPPSPPPPLPPSPPPWPPSPPPSPPSPPSPPAPPTTAFYAIIQLNSTSKTFALADCAVVDTVLYTRIPAGSINSKECLPVNGSGGAWSSLAIRYNLQSDRLLETLFLQVRTACICTRMHGAGLTASQPVCTALGLVGL